MVSTGFQPYDPTKSGKTEPKSSIVEFYFGRNDNRDMAKNKSKKHFFCLLTPFLRGMPQVSNGLH